MRSRRLGPVIVFLIVAAVLLGTGVASARPAPARIDVVTPAGHTGSHCHPVVRPSRRVALQGARSSKHERAALRWLERYLQRRYA